MQKTQKTLVIGSVVAVAFGAVSSLLFPLYATALGALVVPFLVILMLRAGYFCGGLAMAMLTLVALTRAGWAGAAVVLLAYPGISIVITLLLTKKGGVHHATYYGAATMTTGMIAFWAVYALASGSDLATDLLAVAREAMLSTIPTDGALPPMAVAEWTQIFESLFDQAGNAFKMQVLPQMVYLSCLSALLGATLPILYMRKRGLAEFVSTLSPLHTWRIPRRLSLTLMGTYVASFLLALMSVPGMMDVSQAVWRAVEVVYGASCLSFLSFAMRRAAMRKGTRNLLLVLATALMFGLHLLGVIGSMPFVILGVIGEMRKAGAARTPGDMYGPFGPPDPPLIGEDAGKNDGP